MSRSGQPVCFLLSESTESFLDQTLLIGWLRSLGLRLSLSLGLLVIVMEVLGRLLLLLDELLQEEWLTSEGQLQCLLLAKKFHDLSKRFLVTDRRSEAILQEQLVLFYSSYELATVPGVEVNLQLEQSLVSASVLVDLVKLSCNLPVDWQWEVSVERW